MLPDVDMPMNMAYPPRVSEFTRPFWDALGAGAWRTTRCRDCDRQTFPPKAVCPNCWSSAFAWTDLATTGTLYSLTRIHAAPSVFVPEAPYSVGIVDLDAPPQGHALRLACRLVPDARGALPAIGQRVEMVRLRYADGSFFGARLASGDGGRA